MATVYVVGWCPRGRLDRWRPLGTHTHDVKKWKPELLTFFTDGYEALDLAHKRRMEWLARGTLEHQEIYVVKVAL